MKNNTLYNIIAVVLVLLPMLVSCRTELCYNHFAAYDVNLSWNKKWERDYGMNHSQKWDKDHYGFEYHELHPQTPEWVKMIKYTPEGDVVDEQYLEPEGGKVIVDEKSSYTYLLYNGDTEYIVLSETASLTDARATATSRSRASIAYVFERHPEVRSMNPPDVLYAAHIAEPPEIELHDNKPLPVKMEPLVFTYLIRYEFESGIEHVALARGALGGMAESVYLRDGKTSDDAAILLYDCTVESFGCEARVKSFGVPGFSDAYYRSVGSEVKERPYTLNLEVMLKNGKIFEFNYDIADQIEKQPRGGVIRVSGITIDDKDAETDPVESGFDVDVSDWGEHEDIDLPVNPV